ncbi:hypothetical protein Avbf_14399 [Armadillidium vulgare]|nr:hypothetical protein Avbf_14399 [Armadillidium vulgare]
MMTSKPPTVLKAFRNLNVKLVSSGNCRGRSSSTLASGKRCPWNLGKKFSFGLSSKKEMVEYMSLV